MHTPNDRLAKELYKININKKKSPNSRNNWRGEEEKGEHFEMGERKCYCVELMNTIQWRGIFSPFI